MIKAVVIDLDDTLCLTEAVCFEMENEVLASMGREPMYRDIHLSTWGKSLFDAMPIRSPGVDLNAFTEAYRPIIDRYTEQGKLDTISEENYEALDELIQQGKVLMILTSRTHIELKHLIEPDHLLASRVKKFYYRDNMQYHKPDPRAFSGLLKDNGLAARECVYVGDSVSDAAAAKDAGLHFIASLESGLRQRQDFHDFQVDEFIERFPDIVNVVVKLDGPTTTP